MREPYYDEPLAVAIRAALAAGASDLDVAREAKVSPETIDLWAYGVSRPHPDLRPSVLAAVVRARTAATESLPGE